MNQRRRIPWTWIITLLLAAVLLYLALRGVDWNAALETAAQARVELLILSGLLLGVSYFLRSLRWRLLLSAEKTLPYAATFFGTFVGYLGNAVLPARAGELVRSAMISRYSGISLSYVLATTLIERVMDAGALVIVVLLSVRALPIPDWLSSASVSLAAVAVIGVGGLLIAPRLEGLIGRILAALPVPERFRPPLTEFVARFLLGLRALHHPPRAVSFLLLTIIIWTSDVVYASVIAQAFGLAITPTQVLLLLAALGLASAAPSTPGYVGVYQFVAVTVLAPFGISDAQAVVYILAFQLVTYVMVILVGGTGFLYLRPQGAKLTDFAKRQPPAAPPDPA